ncbi:MAG: hypothetical protein O7B35_19960 [Deltaproteobacteria bacterium]|nr:hypothetical protein [Deltaproteobacteria bacterium]
MREVPGVFSQGATVQVLEGNIRDATRLMPKERPAIPRRARSKPITISTIRWLKSSARNAAPTLS